MTTNVDNTTVITQVEVSEDIPPFIFNLIRETNSKGVGFGIEINPEDQLFYVPSKVKTIVLKTGTTKHIEFTIDRYVRLHFDRGFIIGYEDNDYFSNSIITLDDLCSMNILNSSCGGRLFDNIFDIKGRKGLAVFDIRRWLFAFMQRNDPYKMSEEQVVALTSVLSLCWFGNTIQIQPLFVGWSILDTYRFLLDSVARGAHPWRTNPSQKSE